MDEILQVLVRFLITSGKKRGKKKLQKKLQKEQQNRHAASLFLTCKTSGKFGCLSRS